MKLNGFLLTVLCIAVLVPLCWYLGSDETSCTVARAGKKSVNGYYSGYDGVYAQRGYAITHNPDIFSLLTLKRSFQSHSIIISTHMWSIQDHTKGKMVYVNTPESPEDYLFNPPKLGWKAAIDADLPGPIVSHCVGSLVNTEPVPIMSSNIGQLMQRPVTTLLLGIIFAVAYYLWAYKVEVSAVAYSYEAVVTRGEYWRIVTASFAHFDLLHLGFNTMSLYQLGMLETAYGSATFLYLNLSLVLVTMLICTAIYHVLIHRYGRSEYATQQAVGFSCVLFAWMVALSVRLKQYCPIFLLPSFCLDTWTIPLPSALAQAIAMPGIPINIGPFVLLMFTKLVIPRSSFIGHLSGIVIGYPLAWNMIHWLTLPTVISAAVVAWVYTERLYVWTFPGYAASNIDLEGVAPAVALRHYKIAHIQSYFLLASVPVGVYLMGLGQALPRAVLAFLAWSAAHACRVEWLNTSSATREACGRLMLAGVWFATAMMLYDACTLAASVVATELLVGCGLYMGYVRLHMHYLIFMTMVQGLYAALMFGNILEARGAALLLSRVGCDAVSVVEDLKTLSAPCTWCCPSNAGNSSVTTPFSGTAHRLNSSSSSGIVHV